jgi:hypothetical protein
MLFKNYNDLVDWYLDQPGKQPKSSPHDAGNGYIAFWNQTTKLWDWFKYDEKLRDYVQTGTTDTIDPTGYSL